MIFGLFEQFQNTLWSPSASSAWVVKISDIHSVATPLEHNSMLVYLATLRDWIANPAAVAAAMQNTGALGAGVSRPANGGEWWIYSAYYGPQPTLGGALTVANVQGVQRPIFGMYPCPTTDATRTAWWKALSEIEYEVGENWTPTTPALAQASYTDLGWAGIHSEAANGVISEQRIAQVPGVSESATLKTLLYDTATAQPDVLTAAAAFALRLQTAALQPSAATPASALESQVFPTVQQLAAVYDARQSKDLVVAGVTMGALVAGAAIGRMAAR